MNCMNSLQRQVIQNNKKITGYSALGNGLSNFVHAIHALDLEHIFIGGYFTNAGGITNNNYITMWNGVTNNYTKLSNVVLNGRVNAIYALDLEHVFIGGEFINVAGVPTSDYITMWNGVTNNYTALSNVALNGRVKAIHALDLEHVFIGGEFTNAGNITNNNYITMWNGVTNAYAKLTTNVVLNNYVFAIYALDLEHVFIGGTFVNVGGVSTSDCITMWNGVTNTYNALGNISINASITNPSVLAIYALDLEHVYIGGYFINAGGIVGANIITIWNGVTNNYAKLGTLDSDEGVLAIYAFDNNRVYIGGTFKNVGGVLTSDYITMWNGNSFSALGNVSLAGSFNDVKAIYVLDPEHVYIGGDISNGGGISTADNIIMWRGI
jgi:hypothetical protein